MSKDKFRIFKKLSNDLIKEINKNNFLEAQNILNNANQHNINIYKLLRFQIDQATPNLFLRFANFMNINQQETLQYNLYFKLKKQLNLMNTHKLLKECSLMSILEKWNEKAIENLDKDTFSENNIDYLNYILNNHKNYYSILLNKMIEIARLKPETVLFEKSKKEFLLYDYYKNCLNAFRLSYCNIYFKENDFKFYEANDINAIKIANIDADIPSQTYRFFQLTINSPANFIKNATQITLDLINNRKLYELNNYKYKKVELENLIKAYLAIFYESYLSLQKNNLLVKTKEEWKKTLHYYNIFENNSDSFFETMSRSYSTDPKEPQIDIRDTPLIFYNGLYYSVPFSNITSDIANIVVFRIKQNNNIDKKGSSFEQKIRCKWNKLLKTVHIEETESGEQFECDMAFAFDDCLFICELKNEIQPYSLEDWFRFTIKKEQNILQTRRITEHFENSKSLKLKLGKSVDWIPKKTFSLLLYGCTYGIPTKENGVIIANETDIYNFFNKTPIGALIVNENTPAIYTRKFIKGYTYLEQPYHRLTIEDFIEYLKCPMAIRYILDNNPEIHL